MGNKAYTRSFSYGSPVDYQGNLYPSTMMDIEDDKDDVASRNLFTNPLYQGETTSEQIHL